MIRSLRRSLGARMLAWTMLFAAIVVSSLSGLFLWTYNRDLDRQLASRAGALAGFLAGQSQFAMVAVNQRVTRLLGVEFRPDGGVEVYK